MRVLCLFLLVGLSSCQYFQGDKPQRAVSDSLSQDYAALRSQNISLVDYHLQLNLVDEKKFKGTTQINFQLKELFYLTVDFTGGDVQSLEVNGERVKDINYNGFFVVIPQELLKIGFNILKISYEHEYSKNGMGLYRYKDQKDGRSYLYSNFEPYYANKMFPCFDQPNLKATYSSEVTVPKTWQVISANREVEVQDLGELKKWVFPKTLKFSTYTYAIHAGDYEVWESLAKTKNHEIPLRLFARKSVAPFVDLKEWFGLTQSGFSFFEKYYSSPYPYSKYDQVIVPDFNTYAMENVGAVTYSEDKLLSKSEKTQSQKRTLALTLYHEMAHMWFGNLVTMDWWDDLWLNESFATFSSYQGLSKLDDFKETWNSFNSYAKQAAYRLDQSINTHPIAMPIPSTDKAFAHFDAITYAKGASVLKQLSFLLGEKVYRKGLASYFKEHAHQNTKLDDFMKAMEKASGNDLKQWRERWLETAMLNNIEVHFTCKKGRVKHFEIYQTGTQEHPMLRTHKTRIAILRKWRGVYKIHRTKSVEYQGERTLVSSMHGQLCPDIVYPNYKDHDYVTVTLDKKTISNIESSVANVEDPFLRGLLWTDLWQMVLNQKMDMGRYLEVVEYNGLIEEDISNLSKILNSVRSVLTEYYPRETEDWENQRKVWVKFFEQSYLTKITETFERPKLQALWFDSLVSITESPEIHGEFVKLLNKQMSSVLKLSFPLDQDRRWDLVAQITRFDHKQANSLLEKEKERDTSKRGHHHSLYVASLKPSSANKKGQLKKILRDKEKKSLNDLKAMMSGLFPYNQIDLQKNFVEPYYQGLKSIYKKGDRLFVQNFATYLTPRFCDDPSSQKMKSFMEAEKGLSFTVLKTLKNHLFENERCQKMRELTKSKKRNPGVKIN